MISDEAPELARAIALLESYGADETRWPADERVLFAALPEKARKAINEAAEIDAFLAAAAIPSVVVPAGLSERTLANSPTTRQPSHFAAKTTPPAQRRTAWYEWRGIAASALIAAALGVSAGLFQAGRMTDNQTADQLLTSSFDYGIDASADSDA